MIGGRLSMVATHPIHTQRALSFILCCSIKSRFNKNKNKSSHLGRYLLMITQEAYPLY
jgi:hypothetical protein